MLHGMPPSSESRHLLRNPPEHSCFVSKRKHSIIKGIDKYEGYETCNVLNLHTYRTLRTPRTQSLFISLKSTPRILYFSIVSSTFVES